MIKQKNGRRYGSSLGYWLVEIMMAITLASLLFVKYVDVHRATLQAARRGTRKLMATRICRNFLEVASGRDIGDDEIWFRAAYGETLDDLRARVKIQRLAWRSQSRMTIEIVERPGPGPAPLTLCRMEFVLPPAGGGRR